MAKLGDSECIAVVEMDIPHPDAVAEAIEPDNRGAPSHVSIECRVKGGAVICIIRVEDCKGNPSRILTLRNTIDDLTSAVKVALDSIESVGGGKSYKSG